MPGALIAPKMSIIGTVAASLLGFNIHLEKADGKKVDVSKAVKDAADTVADRAKTVANTVMEGIEKTWNDLSADDPEECAPGEENEEEPAGQSSTDNDTPTVQVDPDEPEKE